MPKCREMGAESCAKEAKVFRLHRSPARGGCALIKIKDTKIDNYQCVVPTTGTAHRAIQRNIGAFRGIPDGHPDGDPEKPLEILRTIHSFDPCLACSTHVMSPDGQELGQC